MGEVASMNWLPDTLYSVNKKTGKIGTLNIVARDDDEGDVDDVIEYNFDQYWFHINNVLYVSAGEEFKEALAPLITLAILKET